MTTSWRPPRRGRQELEYELIDTGIFDQDRYFDVVRRVRQGVARGLADPDQRVQPWSRAGTLHCCRHLVPQPVVGFGRRASASRRHLPATSG